MAFTSPWIAFNPRRGPTHRNGSRSDRSGSPGGCSRSTSHGSGSTATCPTLWRVVSNPMRVEPDRLRVDADRIPIEVHRLRVDPDRLRVEVDRLSVEVDRLRVVFRAEHAGSTRGSSGLPAMRVAGGWGASIFPYHSMRYREGPDGREGTGTVRTRGTAGSPAA